jgi:PKHD-type hydroxylase
MPSLTKPILTSIAPTQISANAASDFNFLSPLVFPYFLNPEECTSIIGLKKDDDMFRGVMSLAVSGVRECDMAWLQINAESQWLYDRIVNFTTKLNASTYQFKIDQRDQEIQLTRYMQGDFIDWHPDCGENGAATRKLAVSIQLSDDAEYDGGDLDFFCSTLNANARGQGSIIIFPAFLMHRVSHITRGIRWSLVTWLHGPRFS